MESDLAEAGIVPGSMVVPWAEPADLPPIKIDLSGLGEDLEGPTE